MAMTMHPSLAVHPGDWLKSEVVDPHGVPTGRCEVERQATQILNIQSLERRQRDEHFLPLVRDALGQEPTDVADGQ